MWEQSVDARLWSRRIERKQRLTVLHQQGSVMIHRHRAVGVAVGRLAETENGIVHAIRQGRRAHDSHNPDEEDSSQSYFENGPGCWGHGARL